MSRPNLKEAALAAAIALALILGTGIGSRALSSPAHRTAGNDTGETRRRKSSEPCLVGHPKSLEFPVPWARTPDISFLLTMHEMREALRNAGFAEVSLLDRTALGIEWFDEQQALRSIGGAPPSLGLHVVMGPEFPTMVANLGRNLKEGRAGLVQLIVEKPA
jgi:hypothetical protein